MIFKWGKPNKPNQSNNYRKLHYKPLRRGIVNKKFKVLKSIPSDDLRIRYGCEPDPSVFNKSMYLLNGSPNMPLNNPFGGPFKPNCSAMAALHMDPNDYQQQVIEILTCSGGMML